MKRLLFHIVFLSLSIHGSSQQLVCEKNYGGSLDIFQTNFALNTSDGNIILAAPISRGGYYDMYLIKFNASSCDTIWARIGPRNLAGGDLAIRQTDDGGYIFCGISVGDNIVFGDNSNYVLEKLNSQGDSVWAKIYGAGGFQDTPEALVIMPDAGYLLAGAGNYFNAYKTFFLTRTDILGNVLWKKDYTWSGNDFLTSMNHLADNNILLAGTTSYNSTGVHPKLMIINQNGDSLKGASVILTNDSDVELLKFVENEAKPVPSGILVTGDYDSSTYEFPFVFKTDNDLNLVWKFIYRPVPYNRVVFTKAYEMLDSSVIVLAYNQAPITNRFYFYRFDKYGQHIKTDTFTTALCSKIKALTLTYAGDSSFIVGGGCADIVADAYIAKIGSVGVPVIITNTHIPLSSDQTIALYPNPAKNKITLQISENIKSGKIYLSNLQGELLLEQEIDQPSTEISLPDISSGLYFYRFVSGEKVLNGKLVVE
jgi:hypothetical protein